MREPRFGLGRFVLAGILPAVMLVACGSSTRSEHQNEGGAGIVADEAAGGSKAGSGSGGSKADSGSGGVSGAVGDSGSAGSLAQAGSGGWSGGNAGAASSSAGGGGSSAGGGAGVNGTCVAHADCARGLVCVANNQSCELGGSCQPASADCSTNSCGYEQCQLSGNVNCTCFNCQSATCFDTLSCFRCLNPPSPGSPAR